MLITVLLQVSLGFWFFVTVAALNLLTALSARYSYRLLYKTSKVMQYEDRVRSNIAIIGAGQLGAFLANELYSSPNSAYRPVCFIDTDATKIGSKVAGLRVYPPERFRHCKIKYHIHEVVIAINNADSEHLAQLHARYEKRGCKVKLYDIPMHDVNDGTGKGVIREFRIEDLLFRSPIKITGTETAAYYENKVILVTGGGGSIGSELCRQIAKCHPKKLIVFDIYENNAYDIQQELVRKYAEKLDLCVEIGSVRDPKRLEYVFSLYHPQVVFHAAAHKHVPLMEHSSCEAIKNNVLGTYNTANMAEKYGVEKFILISTDKAVNPTNVMGASKRLCEMVIQCRTDSKTDFAAVRFGNVLGSNGSVIPLFKRQIAAGGPVTVTDKRIIRYFMTIPEASQLVITAGAMANSGELFVLDMGKPVKIYDLAYNMIRLSGLKPEVDIKIEEIGLRPGEKLYEELLMKTDGLTKTRNNLIFIEHTPAVTREEMEGILCDLRESVVRFEEKGEFDAVRNAVKHAVPTFHEPEEVNRAAEKAKEMKMTK